MGNSSFIKNLFRGVQLRLKALRNPYREVNISWLMLKYYKHLPPGKTRTHRLFGKKFYFVSPAELLHGLKEIFIDKLYNQTLPERPYIIDCGANIGLSIIYMKKLFPDAEILAFEPDEKNFDLLSKNLKSFGYENIEIRKEAVWKENTILKFSNEGSMSSKIAEENSLQSLDVKAIRLKDFLNRRIDFLKIDIEGAEFSVIKDISGSLSTVGNLFIEYHGNLENNHELTEMLEIVNKNGFNFYIKEATSIYDSPFLRIKKTHIPYDLQLNIFCFRNRQ